MRTIAAGLIPVVLLLAGGELLADVKADAKRHFDAGLSLIESENFQGAVVEFEESVKLYKTKSALFNLANAYRGLKRYAEVLVTLKLLEGEFGKKIDEEMKKAITVMRQEITTITGTIDVRVEKAGASISIDEVLVGQSPMPVPVLLGAGYHRIRVEQGGKTVFDRKIKLVAGEKKVVEVKAGKQVDAPPAPEAAPEAGPGAGPVAPAGEPAEPAPVISEPGSKRSVPLLVTSIAGTAVTVGLAAVAGVFWYNTDVERGDYDVYIERYDDLDPEDEDYAEDEEELRDRLESNREAVVKNNNIAVGLTVGAGVFAAASVVSWIFWARSGEETAEPAPVSLIPVPGGVGVEF